MWPILTDHLSRGQKPELRRTLVVSALHWFNGQMLSMFSTCSERGGDNVDTLSSLVTRPSVSDPLSKDAIHRLDWCRGRRRALSNQGETNERTPFSPSSLSSRFCPRLYKEASASCVKRMKQAREISTPSSGTAHNPPRRGDTLSRRHYLLRLSAGR